MLICVGGRGWYQEWGKPARELHPGDVVNIPAGVKHCLLYTSYWLSEWKDLQVLLSGRVPTRR